MVGQPTGIVHWYQPWGADESRGAWYQPQLDTDALWSVAERGATPMITWEAWGTVNGSDPSQARTIPTGVYDSYIDGWALGLRDFGQPVYLRLFHELNNQSYPWAYGNNGNSAADLIAAWRYVHDRVEARGAANVEWVWAPSTENQLVTFQTLYPGDDYVDWLGVDGYNGGDIYPEWWGDWVSPMAVFELSLNKLAALDATKPIMIAETATVEQGGDKAAWITELYRELPRRFPQLRAIVWFNAPWGEDDRANWRVDSSAASLDAWTPIK
jgi:beta-mannanase